MANLPCSEPITQAVGYVITVIDADDLLDRLEEYRWTG